MLMSIADVTLAHRQLISLFEAAVTHQEYLKERRQRLQGTSSKSYGRRMSKSSSRTDEDALSSSSRSIPKSMEPAGNSHGIPEAAKQPAKPDVPLWRKSLNYEGFQFLLHRLADNYCLLAYGATPLPGEIAVCRARGFPMLDSAARFHPSVFRRVCLDHAHPSFLGSSTLRGGFAGEEGSHHSPRRAHGAVFGAHCAAV